MKNLIPFLLLTAFLCSCTPKKYSLLTYNIRYDSASDGINRWEMRKDKVVGILKEYQPDVFGVQEALLHQLSYLEEKMSAYTRIGVGRDDGKEAGEFSAVFYKKDQFKALQSGTFWLSETPDVPGKGWDARCCNRICTWVELQEPGSSTSVFVFNTHFDHEGKQARLESAKLILKKIDEIAVNGNFVLMGDLNLTDNSPPYEILTADGILTDCVNYDKNGTFKGRFIQSKMERRIDYIFISKSMKRKEYTRIDKMIDGYYPSDHLPVFVELKVKM